MKPWMLILLVFAWGCKPAQEAPDYGTIIKPLAGLGIEFQTPEEEPIEISYQVSQIDNPNAVDLTWVMVGAPKNGTLANCDKQKLSLSCEYTPNQDFNGRDEIVIKSKDGQFLSEDEAVISIIVTPVPDAPVLGENQREVTPENTPIFIALNPASDVDSKDLVYEPIADSFQNGFVECEKALCKFTPDQDFFGVASFQYRVQDEANLYAEGSAQVDIQVLDYPMVGADQSIDVIQNTSKSFQVNEGSDGDSSELLYELVEAPRNGTLFNCLQMMGEQLSCEYRPNNGFLGADSFTYQVRDTDNLISLTKATVSISVNRPNTIPMVGADMRQETLEEEAVTFQVNPGTDADHRDFTSEPNLTYIVMSQPTNGVLSNCFTTGAKDRTCTYTPNADFYNNTDSFTYLVQDEYGANSVTVAKVDIFVIKKNRIPKVGADQNEETLEEDAVTFTVNAGTDEDHMDPNTDAELQYVVATQPANGTLTNCFNANEDFTDGVGQASDRMCTYTPNANFYDQDDTFTYYVTDGKDRSVNVATVTIKVNKKNRIPKVGDDQSYKLEIDPATPEAFSFVANAGTDEDHMDPNTPAELKYIVMEQPKYGTLTNCFNANEDFTDGFGQDSDRTCVYTPNQGEYDKTDFITYYVMDQQDRSVGTAKISFELMKKNIIPKVGEDQNEETLEEEAVTITVNVGTDGDHMDPNTDAELQYIVMDQPANGTLTNCFNANEDFTDGFGQATDRMCTYTPNANFYDQDDTFTYYVFDGQDRSVGVATVTIKVTKKNRIPKVGADQQYEVYDDESLAITVNMGSDEDHMDPNTEPVLDYILDANRPAQYGQVSNCLNTNVDFNAAAGDPAERNCTYTPDPGSYGNTEVLYYYVRDAQDQSVNMAMVTITIKQRNDPPTVGENQTFTGYVDMPIAFEVNEGNDDNTAKEDLRYVVETPPTDGTLSPDCFMMDKPDQRKCTYTPDPNFKGNDSITYYVLDGSDLRSVSVATVTFTITDKPVDLNKTLCQQARDNANNPDYTGPKILSQKTKVLFQQREDNAGNPIGCTYGQNDNLGKINGVVTAREEYYKNVNLPAGAVLCGADFVFFPDENGVAKQRPNFSYDDELFLTLNDYVLMATIDYSTNSIYQEYKDKGLKVNENGLVEYQWIPDENDMYGLRGRTYEADRSEVGGTYCLGIDPTSNEYATNCKVPVTDTNGDINLVFPNDKIIEVGALSIDPKDPNADPTPESLKFGFIATGDNNPDCRFTDFEFDVTIEYLEQSR